jgi:hypothetical protein
LVGDEVQAWGIGTITGFGEGDAVTVELECAGRTRRRAKAPFTAIITRPAPFRRAAH